MEKKSNGKVIFITALISVITTLVLVVGGFFAFQVISDSNGIDGYYESDRFYGVSGDPFYSIEIKGKDAVVTWNADKYIGEIDPDTETIKLSGGKKIKYTFKLGKLIIEDDDSSNKGEQLIFEKKDKEQALKEIKERREKEEKKSSSSDD